MYLDLLPEALKPALNYIDPKDLNEIRLRINKPILVNIAGKNYYLGKEGITQDKSSAMICKTSYIDKVLSQASDNSLYAVNDQIISGYISYEGGVRIGVCGDVVSSDNKVRTIKNISSVNIRIPHDIKNCSLNAYNYIINNREVQNTLVVSSPGAGKTTFLRDFAVQLGKRQNLLNILIVDERGELSGNKVFDGLDIGDNTDIYTNCTKKFAFENGIRSMKPDVIITDEINLSSDLEAIENAITSGVKVIASIHAKDIVELKSKKQFIPLLNAKLFTRFVVLSDQEGPGTLEGIYNQNLTLIYQ